MSHIGWGGEQTTIYKGVETKEKAQREQYLVVVDLGRYMARFKALRGSPKGKAQREQYLLVVDLRRF